MPLITIRPAEPSEHFAALPLLWSETDEPGIRTQDLLTSAERGEISLKELLVAEIAGRLVGAGLFTVQPGRVGFVWPPGVAPDEPLAAEIQRAILEAVSRRLDELDLTIGQVILEPGDFAMRAVLEQNGFPHLTDLHYMVLKPDSARNIECPLGVETEPFRPEENTERFARALDRTYLGTLDCPELEGLRTAQEAILAHQATGKFDPNMWWLFRHHTRDAGVLFLNEHPDRDLFEIVYLGVVPEARGKGLGQIMVEWAKTEAGRKKRSLVLAVDARNHPARRLYERAGFREVTVQSVHLRQARANAPIPQSTDYAQPKGEGERNS